ncbi:hypothetical protein ACIFOT_15100 [Neobacillus sp. NRS-1170]|uniref:hypothetical protein n=1 Tax=Neobacillus sp. NRS-1170 TaxID=3233898 RepID=UPI003D2C4B1A
MSENMNDNTEQTNPLSNLLKNQNSLDLMGLATSLLKNESLLKSVMELKQNTQTPIVPIASEKQGNAELSSLSLSEQFEKISNDLAELKTELLELKEQNKYLTKLVEKLYNYRKK